MRTFDVDGCYYCPFVEVGEEKWYCYGFRNSESGGLDKVAEIPPQNGDGVGGQISIPAPPDWCPLREQSVLVQLRVGN